MSEQTEEERFNAALIKRLADLRSKSARYKSNQEGFAADLGISRDRYSKYESRTPIRSYLIQKAARLLGVSTEHLLTGHDTVDTSQINIPILIECIKAADKYDESADWRARFTILAYDLFDDQEPPYIIESDKVIRMMRHTA